MIDPFLLQDYVLGELDADAAGDVEALAARDPEVRAEIVRIQQALEAMALYNAQPAPPQARAQVLAAIAAEAGAEPPLPEHSIGRRAPVFRIHRTYLVAAAVILLLSLGFNLWFATRSAQLDRQVQTLQAQFNALRDASQRQQVAQLAAMSDPDNVVLRLYHPDSATHFVLVYWNKPTKDVYVGMNALPKPPPGKQYQLWAIVDDQPVDAGVFVTATDAPMQKVHNVPRAQAFAVTLEPAGGVPKPTGQVLALARVG